ncbi:MAG: hypothetical protein NTX57_19755 [Armatimonadetes bacterium]|nr:hypothetical protein [Armatimonadota bacterium]
MKDEDLQKTLKEAPIPEPIGGQDAARERVMGRVRHQFPPDEPLKAHRRSLWRPLGATALAGVIALVVFLVWPEQSAEADPLPSEAQMQQFYDRHETNHTEHLQEVQGVKSR